MTGAGITTSKIIRVVEHAKAYVVFAHGAGADKSSDFLEQMTGLLNQRGISVLRFNFDYMDKRLNDGKRYPPDRMPKLLECFEQMLAELNTPLPVFLLGKSMGGRVAATWLGQRRANIKGLVCLGYPFHPQKQPDKLRLEPLQQTTVPILIIQGDRDPLGNKDEIAGYSMSDLCRVTFLPDGDHDLKPRKKSGHTHQGHLQTTANLIEAYIDEQC